jgi:hypothetical protein
LLTSYDAPASDWLLEHCDDAPLLVPVPPPPLEDAAPEHARIVETDTQSETNPKRMTNLAST